MSIPYTGGQVAEDLVNDGTDTTVYTSAFSVGRGETWAVHLEWAEDTATFATAVTLWASCKPEPDESSDTDWVQMTTNHNWTGLPGGDPAGGSGKDLVDVGVSGALWYRFKFVRSTGAGTIQAWLVRKDEK